MDRFEDRPEGDLSALERRLGRWRPAIVAVDRDRLMFEAGRASARAGWPRRIERAAAASFALVALGLGGLRLHERSHPRGPDRPLTLHHQAPSPRLETSSPARSPDPDSYLALTRRMLADGAEAPWPVVPEPTPGASGVRPEPPLSPLGSRRPGGLLDL